MHKIDAPGATVSNTFTEGNPSLGIPATEVSDDWLNDVQGELVTVIEGEGITLAKGTITQLQSAIFSMIGGGGVQPTPVVIANNQGSPLDVTGIVLAKATHKSGAALMDIFRQTATQNKKETGWLFFTHNPVTDLWDVSVNSAFEDAGVTFSMTAGGQLQYTSNDLTGGTYVGTLRAASFVKIKQ